MSGPPTLGTVRQLVEDRIRALESDPDSLLRHVDVKRFPFLHSPGFNGQASPHGQWVERPGSTTVKVFRLIGQLGPSLCGPYGDLQGAPKYAVTPKRVKRIKAKFTLRIPGEMELSIALRQKVRLQAKALNELQLERERDPGYKAINDRGGRVEVNPLVKKVAGNMTELTLSSPPMWKKIEQNGPCVDPLFDDEDENDEVDVAELKPVIQTLENWHDPDFMFTELKDKAQYILNTDTDFLDSAGDRVQPDRLEEVYAPGVAVEVDVTPYLWDFSAVEKSVQVKMASKRAPRERSDEDERNERPQRLQRTYVLNIVQMRALHAPIASEAKESAAPQKRGRSSTPVPELTPAKKRPFTTATTDAYDSTAAIGDLGLIDWPTSDIESEVNPVVVGEGIGSTTGKKSGRGAKQGRGRAKGKEKAPEDAVMEAE